MAGEKAPREGRQSDADCVCLLVFVMDQHLLLQEEKMSAIQLQMQ